MTATYKDELSELKAEATKPKRRPRKRPQATTVPPEPETDTDDANQDKDNLENLSQQLSELVHNAETEIRANPVAVTLGAFALGVLVGAIIRR